MTPELITSWGADHLRVSLFSDSVWSKSLETIVGEAFATVPESITSRPIANEASAVGVWEGLKLEVKSTFNRIDFVLQATPSESAPIPFIPNVQAMLPKLASAVGKWAATQSQGITRMAVGCGCFLPTGSVKESYIKLAELIKVIIVDVDRFREFRFQVNLPVNSGLCSDLKINRLSNWASITFRAGLVGGDKTHYFENKEYCMCGLDINTDSDRTEALPRTLIENLASELCTISTNILANGIE